MVGRVPVVDPDPGGSHDRRAPAVPRGDPRQGPGRPARPAGPHPLARRAARRRLGRRRAPRLPAPARRLLGDRLRLAGPGGQAQRPAPVHDRDRRADHPLPACPLARAGRPAAAHQPRLPELGGRVPRGHRPALRPQGPRRRPGRRLPPGGPLPARLRVLHPGPRARLGPGPDHGRLRRADGQARVRPLRRPRWRHRRRDLGRARRGPARPCHRGAHDQRRRWADMKGYLDLQSTRPRTLAYSLTDSPTGQLAWIAQSFKEWTAASAELPEDAVDRDQLLANVSIYWFTRSGASAARFIYETAHAAADWGGADDGGWEEPTASVPMGLALFGGDDLLRKVMDPGHKLAHWTEYDRGGHFAAMEVPDLLVGDLRTFFRELR